MGTVEQCKAAMLAGQEKAKRLRLPFYLWEDDFGGADCVFEDGGKRGREQEGIEGGFVSFGEDSRRAATEAEIALWKALDTSETYLDKMRLARQESEIRTLLENLRLLQEQGRVV